MKKVYKPTSISEAVDLVAQDGDWRTHIFNFVDDFRRIKSFELVSVAPRISDAKIMALCACVVAQLCHEMCLNIPGWVKNIPSLEQPWFVADIENLKAMAIIETPIYFKVKNVFVLENFLSRV